MFHERESSYKKNILYFFYLTLFVFFLVVFFLQRIIHYVDLPNYVFFIPIVSCCISAALVYFNRLRFANLFTIISLTICILAFSTLRIGITEHLFFLSLPILITGLLESRIMLAVITVISFAVLGFSLYLNQGSYSLAYKNVIISMLSIEFLLLLFSSSYRHHLEKVRFELLRNTIETAVFILGYTTELRDFNTGQHLERVSKTVSVIANQLKEHPQYRNYLSDHYIYDLQLASTLHDVGKVTIPDTILKKPGRLSEKQYEIIKTHTTNGSTIINVAKKRLEDRSIFDIAHDIALHHHEYWNGDGYPMGLKEFDIPLSAQIVAVADVYDALATKRPYKNAYPHSKCIEIITKGKGTQFAPTIVDSFLKVESKISQIYTAKE